MSTYIVIPDLHLYLYLYGDGVPRDQLGEGLSDLTLYLYAVSEIKLVSPFYEGWNNTAN